MIVHPNFPGLWRRQSCDQVQQRGLAASGWADDTNEFSRGHLQFNVVQGAKRRSGRRRKRLRHTVEPDFGPLGRGPQTRPFEPATGNSEIAAGSCYGLDGQWL
jgi:hypothetical protein